MADVMCDCPGSEAMMTPASPCPEQASEEDGLCDHCREVGEIMKSRDCNGVKTRAEWHHVDRELLRQRELSMREGS